MAAEARDVNETSTRAFKISDNTHREMLKTMEREPSYEVCLEKSGDSTAREVIQVKPERSKLISKELMSREQILAMGIAAHDVDQFRMKKFKEGTLDSLLEFPS